LAITRGIYFTFSKGKDRDISLAEGLGRLVYTGFRILDLALIDEVVYFAAVKDKGSTPERKFFYSLIFKMPRIGKDGKTIHVYKLRTMHPYSEYIQDYVYNLNGSGKGVKIKDDFRVASWGKFLRKYWLDEPPMLINLLKGDIKLVGVRPLIRSMFNLYPPDLQKLRISTKPGLIPPFYKDLPKTLDEVLESERKYLLAYKRNPIKTDIKYFFNCWYNIIIKQARSS
jgi:lipopolysaccharide/colanic/teichoic acid biosynthesis glycosyltransferase